MSIKEFKIVPTYVKAVTGTFEVAAKVVDLPYQQNDFVKHPCKFMNQHMDTKSWLVFEIASYIKYAAKHKGKKN